MAAAYQCLRIDSNSASAAVSEPQKSKVTPEITGVFRGRELTRKDRRIASDLSLIDDLIGGGIVRGRISEFCGATGSGKTSLAMSFAAQVTRNEAAAWIESSDTLDPAGMIAAGIEPARMLWVSCREAKLAHRAAHLMADDDPSAPPPEDLYTSELGAIASRRSFDCANDFRPRLADSAASWLAPLRMTKEDLRKDSLNRGWRYRVPVANLKAAEWILAAGGFGLVIIDFDATVRFLPQSTALRLARAAERSGAAVIVLGERQMCGTFAALGLTLRRYRACFNRIQPGAPATFDGQLIEARVIRNKLGGSGRSVVWPAAVDQHGFVPPRVSPSPVARLAGQSRYDLSRRAPANRFADAGEVD